MISVNEHCFILLGFGSKRKKWYKSLQHVSYSDEKSEQLQRVLAYFRSNLIQRFTLTVYRFQFHHFVHFLCHPELQGGTKQTDTNTHLSVMKRQERKSDLWKEREIVQHHIKSCFCERVSDNDSQICDQTMWNTSPPSPLSPPPADVVLLVNVITHVTCGAQADIPNTEV